MESSRGPTRGHCCCFCCFPSPPVLFQVLTSFTSIPKCRSECQLLTVAGPDCAGRQECDGKTSPDVSPTTVFLFAPGGLAKPQFGGSSLSRNAAHAYPEHKAPLPKCLTTCSFEDGFLQPFFCAEAVPASSQRSAPPWWMCLQESHAKGRRNPLIYPSTQHICALALSWHLCTELSITHQL